GKKFNMEQSFHRFGFKAMGSFCEVQLYHTSRIEAKRISQLLAGEAARIERKYSRLRTDSVLSDINFSAGAKLGIKIDSETKSLFELARTCFEKSDGMIDITAGILNRIWNFHKGKVPEQKAIDALLPRIGFDRVKWNRSRLYLPHGMEIDFGGLVKQYASDSVARRGRDLGIKHGLVNLGGDFAVIGAQPGNKPWQVGVANPEDHATLIAKIPLAHGGLATSGDFDRCFKHEGKNYSLMLNPKTGWPCSGLRAVCVAANQCATAGSIAAIAMYKAEADGIEFLEQAALPYVCMNAAGRIAGPHVSSEPAPQADAEPIEAAGN
ncbi:MAG: FAD:protein FMN transferase, partial [Gammaproteobacteria bacterium]